MRITLRLCCLSVLVLLQLLTHSADAAAQEPPVRSRALLAQAAALRTQTPLYTEAFAHDLGLWTTESGACADVGVLDGVLRFEFDHGPSGCSSVAGIEVRNALLEVTARHLSGSLESTAALLFRVKAPDRLYAFQVSPSGVYAISEMAGNRVKHLAPPARSAAIHTGSGASNRLTVLGVGRMLAFMVNDVVVQEVSDRSIERGAIGVAAGVYGDEAAAIAFDDLSVWAMGAQPAPTAAPAASPTPPPAATPAAAPSPTPRPLPTPSPTPDLPPSIDTLPIDWSGLEEYFTISDIRLEERIQAGESTGWNVTFEVEARQDVGLFAYMAQFKDDEGALIDSSEVEFSLSPDSQAFLDFIGGWKAGANGTAKFLLAPRLTNVKSISFNRFF